MRVAVIVAVLSGCGFSASLTPTTDGGVPITVGFDRSSSVEDEASGTVMLPVRLNAPSGQVVKVSYTVTAGSATANLDYTASDGRLQFNPGEEVHYIPITIIADGLEEGDETLEIHLKDELGAKLATQDHTMTINSDILPRVYFTLTTSNSVETPNVIQLNLALDVMPKTEVKVGYALTGKAKVALDYNITAGTVVFPPGVMTKQIDLTPIDDALDEDDEPVIVTLTDPIDVIIKPNEGVRTHTLMDNDPEPTVSFTTTSSTVNENVATVNLAVSLNTLSGRTVTVPFTAAAGNVNGASAADYTLSVSPLTIPEGTQSVNVTVTIVDDNMDEFVEGLNVTLGQPMNAMLGTGPTYALSIDDNDPAPQVMFDPDESNLTVDEGDNGQPKTTYKLELTAPSGKPISFTLEVGGTALPVDYSIMGNPVSFTPGTSTATVTITHAVDNVPEPNGTVILDIPNNGTLGQDVQRGTPSQRIHTIRNDD